MSDEKEDLRKRTKRFALRVIKVYESLPRSGSAQVLAYQLLRSGTSVGANFREAHRARSDAEFLSKVGDSLQELEETTYWLELQQQLFLADYSRFHPSSFIFHLFHACN